MREKLTLAFLIGAFLLLVWMLVSDIQDCARRGGTYWLDHPEHGVECIGASDPLNPKWENGYPDRFEDQAGDVWIRVD